MTSSMTTATSTSLLSPVLIPFSFNSSTNILKSTGEEGCTSISCNNHYSFLQFTFLPLDGLNRPFDLYDMQYANYVPADFS